MSEFVDKVLLQFSTPTLLSQLLSPPGDAMRTRARALLDAVYDLQFATVRDIGDVQAHTLEMQRPVFPPERTSGTWTQINPGYTRTEVAYDASGHLQPLWIDIAATLDITLVLQMDEGQIESVIARGMENFTTLDEFRAQFRFIDLDAFMSRHGITTVEELKDRFEYVRVEVKARAPGPFDPADPANQHRYALNVAVLIRDGVDVAAGLRDAKRVRLALEQQTPHPKEILAGEMRTPYALVVIFPAGGITNAAAVSALFAAERVLALFVTPA